MTQDRFANLRRYAGDLGYEGLTLEFCEEVVRRMAPASPLSEYPPTIVAREFEVFMDGMRQLLG